MYLNLSAKTTCLIIPLLSDGKDGLIAQVLLYIHLYANIIFTWGDWFFLLYIHSKEICQTLEAVWTLIHDWQSVLANFTKCWIYLHLFLQCYCHWTNHFEQWIWNCWSLHDTLCSLHIFFVFMRRKNKLLWLGSLEHVWRLDWMSLSSHVSLGATLRIIHAV